MDETLQKLTIGQFAHFNNISEQTLRYYDQIGLLHPRSFNEKTGYRYYHISQCARLDLITHMKSLGISLKDIRRYLDTNDTEWLISTLQSEWIQVTEKIELLQNTKAVLEQKIMDYHHHVIPKAGIPYIEVIPQRTIYKYDTHINYYYCNNSSDNYELMLREFRNNAVKQHLPDIYFYNVSSIMRKENLLAHNYITTELFVFVRDSDKQRFSSCETLDKQTYLCIICDDSRQEIHYISRLMDEIEKNHYVVAGDYICEVISEFLSVHEDERDMVLKLQIPIIFK